MKNRKHFGTPYHPDKEHVRYYCSGLCHTRSRVFTSILKGELDLKNQLCLIGIFGLFSIYGTLSGIQILGAIANIRDLGPMIAGLMGGPIVGLGAGLIGAAHRYFLGGMTALSHFPRRVLPISTWLRLYLPGLKPAFSAP